MASADQISLTPDLAAQARRFAEHRHCSLDELAADALRSYIGLNPEPTAEVQQHLARVMRLGLTPEEYAVLLVEEASTGGSRKL